MIKFLEKVGQTTHMVGETIYHILRGNIDLNNTVKQMVALGVQSLPLVLIINCFTGMVFSLQVAQEFDRFGAASLIGRILSLAVVREMGPILTGIVVAARAGSAIAAELGTMKITEQIDALRALGTSPVQYLVVPRFIACVIMVPVLTVFANLVAMIGGYIVAVYQVGIIPKVFWESSIDFLRPYDLYACLLKTAIFGIIIALSGCLEGLRTERGAQGVGGATISAVVSGMMGIFISNYLLSALLF